jgi:type I restriction enzyme S subunit
MAEPREIEIEQDHLRIVLDILQRLAPQYPVWAFGSRAVGRAKPYSDLDLAIITDTRLPLASQAALAEAFSESDLPWRVDIVDWAATGESFRNIIVRDKVVLQSPAPS